MYKDKTAWNLQCAKPASEFGGVPSTSWLLYRGDLTQGGHNTVFLVTILFACVVTSKERFWNQSFV